MSTETKKSQNKKKIDAALNSSKPSKVLNAKKYAGKVKWGEDPLRWQKKVRDEWK